MRKGKIMSKRKTRVSVFFSVRSKPMVAIFTVVPRFKMYEQGENSNRKEKNNFHRKRTCNWIGGREGKENITNEDGCN